MDPLSQLTLATVVFAATHFVPSTPLRMPLVEAIGEKAYLGAYSLLSFATLGWMTWAYLRAPFVPIFQIPGVKLWPLVVMPFSLILLAAGLMTRNPSAVGQAEGIKVEEPARGILRVTRHPVMWSIALWALVHLVARGDTASAIFFGGLAFVALVGTKLIDRRKDETLGADWKRFAAVTSNVPFMAIVEGRNRLAFAEIGWKRVGVGLAAFGLLLLAHPYLFRARAW